uniref:Uncharacterized protein n=1 Tax=Anguilla anguilla TaxID=7936 RepID=A0A0E9V7Y6_ANGAN
MAHLQHLKFFLTLMLKKMFLDNVVELFLIVVFVAGIYR